jgi:type II secretory pathway component PulM
VSLRGQELRTARAQVAGVAAAPAAAEAEAAPAQATSPLVKNHDHDQIISNPLRDIKDILGIHSFEISLKSIERLIERSTEKVDSKILKLGNA